jgi:hypothetical protein
VTHSRQMRKFTVTQALVRETMNGRIRIVKHRDLFPPGSRQAGGKSDCI